MEWNGDREYIDYTLLKKRGLLKIREQELQKNLKTEGGFVDFTSLGNNPSPITNSSGAASTPTNNFGFLSDMAGVGANSPANPSPLANFDSVVSASSSLSGATAGIGGAEISTLKVKMDDMEYKLDRFIEKIDKLEEKIARFERV